MKLSRHQRLPLVPLLQTYRASGIPGLDELATLPGLGVRFRTIQAARTKFLNEDFLDSAHESAFEAAVVGFYEQCVPLPLHSETLRRRAAIVRHGLDHLLRCAEPLPQKLERCLAANGPYHVSGLGPTFWSALVQALDSVRHPAWTPAVLGGLARLGLARWRQHDRPARVYSAIQDAYAHIREQEPSLSASHIEHFLNLVATMCGRDLWSGKERLATESGGCDLNDLLRQERSRVPLRRRLKERGHLFHEARRELEKGLATQDGPRIGTALMFTDPDDGRRPRFDSKRHAALLALWVGRLWEAQDPYEILEAFWNSDPIPGAGLWLPAAVLHLRDARCFQPWGERIRQRYAPLDDSLAFAESTVQRYRLFNEAAASLCDRYQVHPLEISSLLSALANAHEDSAGVWPTGGVQFGGFCGDTFRFLAELAANNCRSWMEQQRGRYRFAVREPLVELCQAMAKSYIEPVLHGRHGWRMETAARTGRSLTSICKNDYGRSAPYHTALWITFFRPRRPDKFQNANPEQESLPGRNGVQFFIRLDAAGVRYGLRLAPTSREDEIRFRRNIAEQAEPLVRLLSENGAAAECHFGDEGEPAAAVRLAQAEDLQRWAEGKAMVAFKAVPAADSLATASALAGDILLTFDRLLPLYACVAEPEPQGEWDAQATFVSPNDRFSTADFCRATYLDADWLRRVRSLLDLKRQLILQGVPGTGKTHVARSLARVLTAGREEAVRLVQFHPAYSYEEFVEGIRVRSVEVNGRQDLTYPVEDGLLCALAAEASRRPDQPFVLIIDEINRGNLPRIFGELLYLVEYRGETVRLLYSKREFHLPSNFYLIGTMNAADRSVALIDQALRRRFSFLDMLPDAAVLAGWLERHPPREGTEFIAQVVALFDRLNTRLRRDRGPQFQIGHSYFMVPDFDRPRLQVVWDHHVQPLLDEYFHGHPELAAAYALDRLLGGGRRVPANRRRPVSVSR
ncbi:MAG TPA: DUF2461 family protein [Gemmataceae bacterium]|nr:DUF2461 family protein [Gemmataceae bacterium]